MQNVPRSAVLGGVIVIVFIVSWMIWSFAG